MDKDGYHGHDKQPPKPWNTPISSDYERGFIDGMQKQAQSSVDRAVNAMTRRWHGLTDEEIIDVIHPLVMADMPDQATDYEIARAIEAKLKEKNSL